LVVAIDIVGDLVVGPLMALPIGLLVDAYVAGARLPLALDLGLTVALALALGVVVPLVLVEAYRALRETQRAG
ncbi:MAG TPA: hypothetical protein VFW86_01135, partial [Candidatus Limnocylindrales bacterium]|nr:hypothetical protein [Candidatus Limnocylindrales bacterium]